jgi:hypothetical protein
VKHRLPILENTVRLETEHVPSITIACFVFHNVSKYLQDEDFQFHPEVAHDDLENEPDQREPNIVYIRVAGQRKRHELAFLKIEDLNFVPTLHALFIFCVFDLSVSDGRIKKEVTICSWVCG